MTTDNHHTRLNAVPPYSGSVLSDDEQQKFSQHYNRSSFMFPHKLKDNPLFELPSLIELSQRLPAHPDFAYWSSGSVAVTDPWEKGVAKRRSLQDTIADIANNNSIVILKHTEQDHVFGPVLQALLAKFVEFSGAIMRNDVTVGEALILIASPNRITPYHFDAECNYLVQVVGDKTFHVFDDTIKKQVSDEELELYFAGHPSSAQFSDEKQRHATAYDLRAGNGVHVPSNTPHWVRNGDNISIALSINYELRSVQQQADVYWINQRLRRLGMKPTPPGVSRSKDLTKRIATKLLKKARSLAKPEPKAETYPVWTPTVP